MARLIGLLLLVGLGWLALRRLLGSRPAPAREAPREPSRFEKTVRCERCGVHLPLALAREHNGETICADGQCEQREKIRESRNERS